MTLSSFEKDWEINFWWSSTVVFSERVVSDTFLMTRPSLQRRICFLVFMIPAQPTVNDTIIFWEGLNDKFLWFSTVVFSERVVSDTFLMTLPLIRRYIPDTIVFSEPVNTKLQITLTTKMDSNDHLLRTSSPYCYFFTTDLLLDQLEKEKACYVNVTF